ncbi:hypothetical protein GDO86_009832 [Hymenochirus boettgeri]|uniref:Uncharacterized protein n=1 Tax=Hymenochirus boettgeri TaxID=247094 RepID=A0A8T2JKK8_9PIPI|nr:hypothetical protein GDO86_009832 [Hymenochirus boettgeri]
MANCSHCKCPRNCRSLTMGLKLEPRGPVRRESQRPHTFWRPWIYRSHKPKPYACSLRENPRVPQKPAEYNHPVR